jgi:acetyl esterase/lipase
VPGALERRCSFTCTAGRSVAADPRFQPGFEDTDTSVTGVVVLYGFYGVGGADLSIDRTPAAASAGPPPFFVAHGDRDGIVPVGDARAFVGRLRSTSGSAVVYAELPGGQHLFDLFRSCRFEAVIDGVEAFAAWVRSSPLEALPDDPFA